jgi:F-type H+-transporting ATPase subunit delta
MSQKKIARKYASALMELAKEDKKEARYGEEILSFATLLKNDKSIWNFFVGPAGSLDIKKSALKDVLSKVKFSKVVKNFLHLLLDKERLVLIGNIAESYHILLDEAEGKVRAKIVSAAPLTKTEIDKIIGGLSATVGKKIVADVSLDTHIIGGVVVYIGGFVFDGSIKTQLENIGYNLKKGQID